jgi:nucleoside-diphosphate-sugar epimerase
MDLRGKRIVVTGPTGQWAKPTTIALAAENEVFGLARFGDAAARAELESAGVTCIPVDLAAADFSAVPSDVDVVLNLAVAKTKSFDHDLAANAESVGLLMQHCASATAFLHCSSTGVYQPNGHHPFAETDPLGDNHRVLGFMPTYSISKIAAEAVARTAARQFGVPTTIARLNVPYGNAGGWPWLHLEQILAGQPVSVHTDAPSIYNPIHEDDILASLGPLLDAASVPATIVNWGGSEAVSVEEWSAYLAELVGKPVSFAPSDRELESVTIDRTRQDELVGPTSVAWRDGFRRMVEAFHPELTLADV